VTLGNFRQRDLENCYLNERFDSNISVFLMNTGSDSFPEFLLLMNSVICYSLLLHYLILFTNSTWVLRGQS
jgi:hypothetical protein